MLAEFECAADVGQTGFLDKKCVQSTLKEGRRQDQVAKTMCVHMSQVSPVAALSKLQCLLLE